MRISDWSSDVCSSDLERTRALARFVAGVGICRPAPVDHVVDADALLLPHHGQQPFWLRGGNRGDLCRRAAGRDQAVLQGEVVAADAVPYPRCVAAGDVRLAAREPLPPVLSGPPAHGPPLIAALAAGTE